MIDPLPLLKIAPVFAVALISPGPDFMMITSMALSRGRMAGLLASFGIASGTALYASLSVLGLGVVFTHLHLLSVVVRLAGGLYLLYLAVLLWKESFRSTAGDERDQKDVPAVKTGKNPYVTGFVTNMTNPKAVAFFTSIFAFVLPADVSAGTQMALVSTVFVMAFTWFSFVVLVLSAPTMRRLYQKISHWIDRVAGTCLGFFGVRLILSTQD